MATTIVQAMITFALQLKYCSGRVMLTSGSERQWEHKLDITFENSE